MNFAFYLCRKIFQPLGNYVEAVMLYCLVVTVEHLHKMIKTCVFTNSGIVEKNSFDIEHTNAIHSEIVKDGVISPTIALIKNLFFNKVQMRKIMKRKTLRTG